MNADAGSRGGGWRGGLATLAAAALPLPGVAVLAAHGNALAAQVDAWPIMLQLMVVVGAGAALCGAALLPTHAVSLTAGWLFGAVGGPLLAWTSVVIASTLGHALGGRLAGRGLAELALRRPRWRSVHAALVTASPGRTIGLIALLRLSPLAPFAATNVALAGFGVDRRAMVAGSAIGLLPRAAIVAWLGAGMARLDFARPTDPVLVVLGIAATLAALILMGWAAKRSLDRAAPTARDTRYSPSCPCPGRP